MIAQRTGTDDDIAGPPPMAAVAAARRAEIEEARLHENEQDLEIAASSYLGVLVVILAVLSAIAVWMTS